jgi:hypothetical protein
MFIYFLNFDFFFSKFEAEGRVWLGLPAGAHEYVQNLSNHFMLV